LGRGEELLLDDREQVFFLHDEQFVAVDLDGLAAVLAEQDAVADLDAMAAASPLSFFLPGPTASTSPWSGFSAACRG
jgi:hypothetical protein